MPDEENLTISELSARSGVPVATIKFYLREGLLPPGDRTRAGRGYYGPEHAQRLAVIRALRDTAGLPVAVIRRVLDRLDSPSADAIDVIGPAIDALSPPPPRDDAPLTRAAREVDAFLAGEGIKVRAKAGAKNALARALVALRAMRPEVTADELAPYLASMRALAAREVANAVELGIERDNARALELAVLGTVLWEPAILALRRLLHEHLTTEYIRRRRRPRR